MPLPMESYIEAERDNAWIREFLNDWELDRKTGGADLDLSFRLHKYSEQSPDSALALIVSLSKECPEDQKEEAALAEELEWFLLQQGEAYWETLNDLCSRLHYFRRIMAEVWGASLSKDLKRKVEMWRI
jgi:hypothetical protein